MDLGIWKWKKRAKKCRVGNYILKFGDETSL